MITPSDCQLNIEHLSLLGIAELLKVYNQPTDLASIEQFIAQYPRLGYVPVPPEPTIRPKNNDVVAEISYHTRKTTIRDDTNFVDKFDQLVKLPCGGNDVLATILNSLQTRPLTLIIAILETIGHSVVIGPDNITSGQLIDTLIDNFQFPRERKTRMSLSDKTLNQYKSMIAQLENSSTSRFLLTRCPWRFIREWKINKHNKERSIASMRNWCTFFIRDNSEFDFHIPVLARIIFFENKNFYDPFLAPRALLESDIVQIDNHIKSERNVPKKLVDKLQVKMVEILYSDFAPTRLQFADAAVVFEPFNAATLKEPALKNLNILFVQNDTEVLVINRVFKTVKSIGEHEFSIVHPEIVNTLNALFEERENLDYKMLELSGGQKAMYLFMNSSTDHKKMSANRLSQIVRDRFGQGVSKLRKRHVERNSVPIVGLEHNKKLAAEMHHSVQTQQKHYKS